MCKYDDKTVKSIESEHLETIKAWKKEFAKKPYSQTEIGLMSRCQRPSTNYGAARSKRVGNWKRRLKTI